jgi:NADH-quinone oxidoreductase subunit L
MIGLLTSLMTAVYMFRVVFLAFHGARADHPDGEPSAPAAAGPAEPHRPARLHDAPPAMAFALGVLAIGSVVAGWIGVGSRFERFLEPAFAGLPPEAGADPTLAGTLMVASSAVALAGIGLAWWLFLRNRQAADALSVRFSGIYRVLVNKYYVDEVYNAAIVEPIHIVSEEGLWKGVDAAGIDGAVNGVGEIVRVASRSLRLLQTGSVRAYAASLFLGVVAILGYYLWQ